MLDALSFRLPVVITKQGRRFVAYTPALDISTSGTTKKNVQKRFAELAQLFFEEIAAAGTMNEVLSELGWTKARKRWTPPQVVSAESVSVHSPVLA
ncbi:MAG: hypothetical protein KGI73_03390 [Patescibacteria group bacterium]|nr:hypothetical protein [Patescibacteria group bacterium]